MIYTQVMSRDIFRRAEDKQSCHQQAWIGATDMVVLTHSCVRDHRLQNVKLSCTNDAINTDRRARDERYEGRSVQDVPAEPCAAWFTLTGRSACRNVWPSSAGHEIRARLGQIAHSPLPTVMSDESAQARAPRGRQRIGHIINS